MKDNLCRLEERHHSVADLTEIAGIHTRRSISCFFTRYIFRFGNYHSNNFDIEPSF